MILHLFIHQSLGYKIEQKQCTYYVGLYQIKYWLVIFTNDFESFNWDHNCTKNVLKKKLKKDGCFYYTFFKFGTYIFFKINL